MPSSSFPSPERRVLVCLENPQAAVRIQSVLSQYGFATTAISPAAMPDEGELAGSLLVVTYTAMIGRMRAMLDLPLVNVEAFIFETPNAASPQPKRLFDGAAFVKRILAIVNAERRLTV
ncbi:hypothetical protein NOF55_10280 [Rhizobiaceae bacterium BDR2-2]|uniref:Uncharacterized protein n=1 Tax=Ectorhizobium quercum TaxID=2965071 RepID=A0AAE3MZV9_9HYPH|nr:hypothetical protein [Ectorhizobium quercum]MCX8997496.1 hypothetical protein [Ectorhizobium quercum]